MPNKYEGIDQGGLCPPVLVVTRYCPTALAIVRSLGAAGFTVDVIASVPKSGDSAIVAASKYSNELHEVVAKNVKKGGTAELLAEIELYGKEHEGRVVLFPTDDYTTYVVDSYRENLAEKFIIPGIDNEPNAVVKAMSKAVQSQAARTAGLATPQEYILTLSTANEIPEETTYPCFVKPLESFSGNKGEIGVCNNREELAHHLQWLNTRQTDRDVLIQEYLDIDREIVIEGICCEQQVIIPAIINKTHVAQFEKGVTLCGKISEFSELGSLQEPIIRLMQSFNYTGMFDLELNVVGEKIFFGEINFRSGGPNYSYFRSGVNLPAVLVKEMLGIGHESNEELVSKYDLTFVNEKVAWKDYANGYMNKQQLDTVLQSVDCGLIHDEADPEPGKVFDQEMKNYVQMVRNKKNKKSSGIRKMLRPLKAAVRDIINDYPQARISNRRSDKNIESRVIVIGRNYCNNLCMARSLGEAGYEVEIVKIFSKVADKKDSRLSLHPEAYSKYVKSYREVTMSGNSRKIANALISMADPRCKLPIIPTDDVAAYILDEFYDDISKYFITQNVSEKQGEVVNLMGKKLQSELASQAGLTVTNSCIIKTKKGNLEIPEGINYPCFIKPNISRRTSKTRMRRCENETELRTALQEMSDSLSIEILVEDYLEIKREISVLGMSAGGNVRIAGAFAAESGGTAARKGVAVVGKTIDVNELGVALSGIDKFVNALNYKGLFDIDLVEDVEGKLYFVEINMRYGASGYVMTECGVNLPAEYIKWIKSGQKENNSTTVKKDVKFASEKILLEELKENNLKSEEVDELAKNIDVWFIKNDKDKNPYSYFKKAAGM